MSYVRLPPWAFAACWLCILAVHVGAGAYYALFAFFYWVVESTNLDDFLMYFDIGMAVEHYHTIALVHSFCAVPHAAAILSMIGGSIYQRTLTFHIFPSQQSAVPNRLRTITTRISSTPLSRFARRIGLWELSAAVFGSTGYFGVVGRHYGAILFVRELTDTALQTAQAYRMSYLVPRIFLNRFYAGLLVMNCWVLGFVHAAFSSRKAHQRFFSLLCDCVLDLVSSIGVTVIIVVYYLKYYDWELQGFYSEYWIGDTWFSQAKNEFQMVFVTSWTNLAARVFFAFGAVSSLHDMKALLCRQSNRVHHRTVSNPSNLTAKPLGPMLITPNAISVQRRANSDVNVTPTPSRRRYARLAQALFASWGLLILVFHAHAAFIPKLDLCLLQVRPWGVAKPYCYLVELNCERLGVSGTSEELTEIWETFGRQTVERITIRHCPHLEIPSLLTDFVRVNALKIYNSSIIEWSSDAAITAASHPHIALIYLIRVTVPDGEIPVGLLSSNFPTTLQELTFCVSNLQRLPNDLDTLWPKGIVIKMELSQLTFVPECLLRLKPLYLSVYGNPIDTVPSELFEIEGMTDLDIGVSNIVELPRNVTALSSTLRYISLPYTNVSVYWSWIDPLLRTANPDDWYAVYAPRTPYCDELLSIMNGTLEKFSAPLSSSDSLMMDFQDNSELISSLVTCDDKWSDPYFPLAQEDALAAQSR